ncbi:YcnI family protein [Aeromicrobium sp.]|uniref:YcnI family copper-binding membrane protein n=1 Tax=Aeromicrobium sp. TaxID=1871063 RepID=UPI0019A863CE|nr:YcnI family protein [Aeromicrobium sp.]MBC7632341.1 YcnI family protein [Aeromicrobium sp.]
MNCLTTRLRSAALISTTTALVSIAGPASAHVSVWTPDALRGGFGKAVFRVATESETASTKKVVVTLPEDTPFAFVSAGYKPGWKAAIAMVKLAKPTKVGEFTLTKAARTVTWTTTGDGIPPSQFDEFSISGGPMPQSKDISFVATQTYSDGEVVAWNQPQKGDTEPEHPAPVLALTASASGAHADPEVTGSAKDDSGNDAGIWLGGGALVVAATALVVALRQNRRRG